MTTLALCVAVLIGGFLLGRLMRTAFDRHKRR